MAGSGYALVLQVAHPTVAAGVREHSNYAQDPFGRLIRTLDYLYVMTYGGPEAAAATASRLREMHKRIRGEKPDGSRYSALEPEPFAWVHATLFEAVVKGSQYFGVPLRPDQIERLWREWLDMARLIGIHDDDLPRDMAGYRDYFDRMVDERLEDSDTVQEVLSVMTRPAAPPVPLIGGPLWKLLRVPLSRPLALATTGFLPRALRERFGLRWTRAQELELRALGRISRSTTPVLPARIRNVGPAYLAWRRQAIARSESDSAGNTVARLAPAA